MREFNETQIKLKGIETERIKNAVQDLLINDEELVAAFDSARDKVIFTNFRIIFYEQQGLAGVKYHYTMIPYKHITAYAIETAGSVERDCSLEMVVNGIGHVKFAFTSGVDVFKLSQVVSFYVL
ncbi:MAG: PH domain-containing protein [Oscillospiraceae bacterium]|jgi:hypothetical protein|nr:PH domain-containing protein [Oscillospiraceae bacterium]